VVTFAVSLTVYEIQAVLTLKTTFLLTPLEFDGHTVGPCRFLCSSYVNQLVLSRVRTATAGRSFPVAAPTIWNRLLRYHHSLQTVHLSLLSDVILKLICSPDTAGLADLS